MVINKSTNTYWISFVIECLLITGHGVVVDGVVVDERVRGAAASCVRGQAGRLALELRRRRGHHLPRHQARHVQQAQLRLLHRGRGEPDLAGDVPRAAALRHGVRARRRPLPAAAAREARPSPSWFSWLAAWV